MSQGPALPHRPLKRAGLGRLSLLALTALVAVLVALLVVMAVNSWRMGAAAPEVSARAGVKVDAQAAAIRLSQALQFQTISTDEDTHAAAFEGLHRFLAQSFPAVHGTLKREVLGRHALLYTWPGTDAKAPAVALLSHQDVVPVSKGTEGDWTHPPFAGTIANGQVWGRGAWDDKASMVATLEAVESLLKAGFKPRQTIYLAFGADEELGGDNGAKLIAQALRDRRVRLRFILDEGLLITHGMVPGVAAPVAMVGVAQKGFLSLKLTAKGVPGHSSQPPKVHAIGVLAQVIDRLEAHPLPARLAGLPRETLEAVAPHAAAPMRLLFSNLWLTAPLIARELEKSPTSNAMLRTTAVPTILQGGERENVIPGRASVVINYRLMPGDTSEAVIEHVQGV